MRKKIIIILAIVVVLGVAWHFIVKYREAEKLEHARLFSGNGRIEATEINIAAKLAGRIEKVLVEEGDFVTEGQTLVHMQTNVLEAELEQAKAKYNQSITEEASSKAMIEVRISERESAKAVVLQHESTVNGARKRYDRFEKLRNVDATSDQQYEDSETLLRSSEAQLVAAQASVKQAEAVIESAKAEAAGATAAIKAAEADIARIQADIDDSTLVSPRIGRVQYRIAQTGEVLSAGGRVLNLVDLTDVYMTFFLPEEIAGKVQIGAEVRIVLDALPDVPIPASVTYVASVAQFTPKTVETQKERQKLMFRVKARIDPELLKAYLKLVKTGVPGMAWVKVDPEAVWPKELELKRLK